MYKMSVALYAVRDITKKGIIGKNWVCGEKEWGKGGGGGVRLEKRNKKEKKKFETSYLRFAIALWYCVMYIHNFTLYYYLVCWEL